MNSILNIKGWLVVILINSIPICSIADNIDTLKNQLAKSTDDHKKFEAALELGNAYFDISQDSILKYFELAKNYGSKTETKTDDLKLCKAYGYFHTHRSNDYQEANQYYFKALKMAEKSNDLLNQALIYNDLGIVGWKQGKYLESVENYYKAKEISDKLDDPDLEMRVCLSLGIVHNESALQEEAKALYQQGLELAEQLDNQKSIGMFLNNLGKLHRDLKDYAPSLVYFNQADSLFKSQEQFYWITFSQYNLGYTHLEAGNLERSKSHLDSARLLNAKYDNVFMDLMIDCEVAKFHEEKGHFAKAIKISEAALEKLEALNTELFYVKLFPILANSYEKIGSTQKAVSYYKKSNEIAAKMNALENQNELIKRNAIIEYRKKALEIERLKVEVERENMQVKKVLGYLGLAIFSLFLILAGASLLFYRMKLKQLEKYVQLRTKLTYDLHDNVGSSLNQIKMLATRLNLSKEEGAVKKKQSAVNRIKTLSNDLISNMQDLIWSMDPENETLENLIDKMKDHVSNVLVPIDLPYRMKVNGDFNNIILDPEVKANLYSLFKEAINNVTKHTKPDLTLITMNVKERNFHLRIENGKEVVVESKFSSKKGLHGMRARAKEINGILEIEDLADKFIVDLKVAL